MGEPTPPRNQTAPQPFIVKQGAEWLTGQAGLALVGLALYRFGRVREGLDRWFPKRSGLSVAELVITYVGLLCLGKSDGCSPIQRP